MDIVGKGVSNFYSDDELDELSDFSDASLSFGTCSAEFALAPTSTGGILSSGTASSKLGGVIEEDIRVIRQKKGAHGLIAYLESSSPNEDTLIQVLELLADGETSLVTLKPSLALKVLTPLLSTAGDVQVVRLICSLFGMLAFCDANKTSLVKHGAIRIVTRYMRENHENDKLMCLCVETICTIAQHADSDTRKAMANQGVIETTVLVMNSIRKSLELQSCGCRLLELMAFSDEFKSSIIQFGGLCAITSALDKFYKCSVDVVTHGCSTLYFMIFEIEQLATNESPDVVVLLAVLSKIVNYANISFDTRVSCVAVMSAILSPDNSTNSAKAAMLSRAVSPSVITAIFAAIQEIGPNDVQALTDGITLLHLLLQNVKTKNLVVETGESTLTGIINSVVLAMGEHINNPTSSVSIQKHGQEIVSLLSLVLQDQLRSPTQEDSIEEIPFVDEQPSRLNEGSEVYSDDPDKQQDSSIIEDDFTSVPQPESRSSSVSDESERLGLLESGKKEVMIQQRQQNLEPLTVSHLSIAPSPVSPSLFLKTERRMGELQLTIKSKDEKLAAQSQELSTLRTKCRSLEDKLEEVECTYGKKMSEVQGLLDTLRSQNHELEKQHSKAMDEGASLRHVVDTQKQELDVLTSDANTLRQVVEDQKQELQLLQCASDETNESSRQVVDIQNQELELLRSEGDSLRQVVENQKQKLEQLQRDTDEASTSLREVVETQEQEIKTLRSRNEELVGLSVQEAKEMDSLKLEAKSRVDELNSLSSKLETQTRLADELQVKLSNMERENEGLSSAKAQQVSELDAVSSERDKLRAKIDDLGARVSAKDEEVDSTISEMAALRANLDNISSELESLTDERNSLRTNVSTLERERIMTTQNDSVLLTEKQTEIEELRSKLETALELQKQKDFEVSKLRLATEAAKREADKKNLALQHELNNNTVVEELQSKVQSLQQRLEEKERDTTHLRQEAEESTVIQKTFEAEILALQEQIAESAELQSKVESLQEVLSAERKKRATIEGEVASLRFDKQHSDSTFHSLESSLTKSKQLEEQLETANINLANAKEEMFQLKDEIIVLEDRIQTVELENRRHEKKIEVLTSETVVLKATIKEKDSEIEALTHELQLKETSDDRKRREDFANLKRKVRSLQDELTTERNNASIRQKEKVDIVHSQLDTEYKMLVKSISASKARLEQRVEELESEREQLAAKLLVTSQQTNTTATMSAHAVSNVTVREAKMPLQTSCDDFKKPTTPKNDWKVDVSYLPFLETLKQLFKSLSPFGAPIAHVSTPKLYHFVKDIKLVTKRERLDVVLAKLEEHTKRKGKVCFDGFVFVVLHFAKDKIKRGIMRKSNPSFDSADAEIPRKMRYTWMYLDSFMQTDGVQAYLNELNVPSNQAEEVEEKVSVVSSSSSESDVTFPAEADVEPCTVLSISKLWQRETKPLRDIFSFYSKRERDASIRQTSTLDNRTSMHYVHEGVNFQGIVQMGLDFDIIPSLFGRNDLRKLFQETLQDTKSGYSSLDFNTWLLLLERIAVSKFPKRFFNNSQYSAQDFQVAAMLQWMDASNGKLKLRKRVRSGVVVRKFNIVRFTI